MPFDSAALRRDIDFLISDMLSAEAQRTHFVAFAREEISEFTAAWSEALKRPFRPQVFVDGRRGAQLEEVNWPSGVILAQANPLGAAVHRAIELLNALVKVKRGRLQRSLAVYADGERAAANAILDGADTVALTYLAPYFRRGEREGWNVRGGADGGQGLIAIVTEVLKREFRGAPLSFDKRFKNFGESEANDDRIPGLFISVNG